MPQLRTFTRGGIHPPEEKISAASPICYGTVPKQLLIQVNQHIGKPSKIIVEKGMSVVRGQPLTESDGFVSSVVHAPVAGKVQKIMRFPLLGGQVRDVIVLSAEQAGQDYRRVVQNDEYRAVDIDALKPNEIRETISRAGIVGMGGAGFPTHVKLTPPEDKKIDTLLINGAECEPYITADHRLMLERGQEIVTGIRILKKLFPSARVFIGIEENKPDALENMSKFVRAFPDIQVIPLKTKYPQGGEKQLIKAILNREVPSGGLPLDVGVIAQNVATVLAVHDAFFYRRPLMERVVTVSGELVKQPANIVLPIGTPVSYVMERFGVDAQAVRLFIAGGPMMGKTSFSFESPVTKTTSALLFFSEKAYVPRQEKSCIRCGSCLDACPMGLPVAQLVEAIKANLISDWEKSYIKDCMECGCCTYVCPAERRLVHWMRLGKNLLTREN